MKINVFDEAKKLAELPAMTDSRDWKIGGKVLYEIRDCKLWSKICLLAIAITSNVTLKIWLLIEFVNGWRRQPGKWDIEFAVNMLDAIKLKIDETGDLYPKKNRLYELWAYHRGWVYRSAGEFQKAAQVHEISLGLATSEFGRVVASHNMAMEFLNAAIVNNDQQKIASAFAKFQKANSQALEFFTDDPSGAKNIRWWINIQYHDMWYKWLLEKISPVLEILKRIDGMLAELKIEADSASAVIALKMLHDYCQGDYEKSVQAEIDIAGDKKDWFHYAAIVQTLALLKLGRASEAKKQIEAMLALKNTEHGGHLAYAIISNGIIPELAQFA